jgi:hypothetical protein
MRAVWSFWSKPFLASTGTSWREPLHHLLAWGLSLRLGERHYPETLLVTDEAGKSLLVDQLGLKFTHVSTELEQLHSLDADWWAMGKLYAYSLQDKPFVHMDTDVFLWKPLPARLTNAPVFGQCPEFRLAGEGCGPQIIEQAFLKHGLTLPKEWVWTRSQSGATLSEVNCGIMGGTHVEFIRYYAKTGLDLVLNPANAPAWAGLSYKIGLNIVIEQFFLGACIAYWRRQVAPVYRGVQVQYLFSSLDHALEPRVSAKVGFTHLLGGAKRDATVTQRLEERFRRDDPDYYDRCQLVAAAM